MKASRSAPTPSSLSTTKLVRVVQLAEKNESRRHDHMQRALLLAVKWNQVRALNGPEWPWMALDGPGWPWMALDGPGWPWTIIECLGVPRSTSECL